jgi:hypothetical protein
VIGDEGWGALRFGLRLKPAVPPYGAPKIKCGTVTVLFCTVDRERGSWNSDGVEDGGGRWFQPKGYP